VKNKKSHISLWLSGDLLRLQWRLCGAASGRPDGIIEVR
jgi:hypothetical protein